MTCDSMHTRILAYHEASHAVVAWVLGRPIELLSIRPGAHYEGVVTYRGWTWLLDRERTAEVLWRPGVLHRGRDRRRAQRGLRRVHRDAPLLSLERAPGGALSNVAGLPSCRRLRSSAAARTGPDRCC
jgi:hypothetical protein